MPYVSPPTLTRAEQQALLEASAANPRDHLVISLALGTGLRLSEIVGLNVGDLVYLSSPFAGLAGSLWAGFGLFFYVSCPSQVTPNSP